MLNSITPRARGEAIRAQAETNRKMLDQTPAGWTNEHEPQTEVRDGATTDFRWLQGPQGEHFSGFQSKADGEIQRFNVGLGNEDFSMRRVPHPARFTTSLGEAVTNVGFGLAAGVPGGWIVGSPLMSVGQWLSHSSSAPDDVVYRHEDRSNGFQSEWAVFDGAGQYVSDEPRQFQKSRFY